MKDDSWRLSRLCHESDDVIIEVHWQLGQLKVVIETNKSVTEKICQSLVEIQEEISELIGEKRAQYVLNNWSEVSYRKCEKRD